MADIQPIVRAPSIACRIPHSAGHTQRISPTSTPPPCQYYPPNGWNCRCTVVQVRKSKYPVTPHDEAMARGAEATGKDTKGIFQFNPGIQQKTFPDYNPYTIRRCRDCDIAKGKEKLAKQSVPENELCAACQLLQKCANANKEGSKILIPEDEYKRILDKPLKEQFVEIYQGVKGKVLQHELACINTPDFNRVLSVAKAFADNIGDCRINPEIQKLFTEGRKKYLIQSLMIVMLILIYWLMVLDLWTLSHRRKQLIVAEMQTMLLKNSTFVYA